MSVINLKRELFLNEYNNRAVLYAFSYGVGYNFENYGLPAGTPILRCVRRVEDEFVFWVEIGYDRKYCEYQISYNRYYDLETNYKQLLKQEMIELLTKINMINDTILPDIITYMKKLTIDIITKQELYFDSYRNTMLDPD